MDGDKAPSPNGFYIAFFRLCWNVVKLDILSSMTFSFLKKFKSYFYGSNPKKRC